MKTIQLWRIAGAALLLAGCGGGSDNQESLASSASSLTSLSIVTVTVDPKGGYSLSTMSGALKTVHVDALDLSSLGQTTVAQMSGAGDRELVLRGTFESGETFKAQAAWRGMPGVTPAAGSELLAPSVTQGEHVAQVVETGLSIMFKSVNVVGTPAYSDTAWLTAEAMNGDALVAGSVRDGVIRASQVYVALPAGRGACTTYVIECGAGEVATDTLETNLCLTPSGCATVGVCAENIPECGAGYNRISWAAQPTGCPSYACLPTFISE